MRQLVAVALAAVTVLVLGYMHAAPRTTHSLPAPAVAYMRRPPTRPPAGGLPTVRARDRSKQQSAAPMALQPEEAIAEAEEEGREEDDDPPALPTAARRRPRPAAPTPAPELQMSPSQAHQPFYLPPADLSRYVHQFAPAERCRAMVAQAEAFARRTGSRPTVAVRGRLDAVRI